MLETEEIKGRSNAALEMALEGMRLLLGHKKKAEQFAPPSEVGP